jgi:hypothetical protein
MRSEYHSVCDFASPLLHTTLECSQLPIRIDAEIFCLQSWDVSNLFVVGGSAFPQNPANGPTETIGMLACWAADAIKENYARNPGSLV